MSSCHVLPWSGLFSGLRNMTCEGRTLWRTCHFVSVRDFGLIWKLPGLQRTAINLWWPVLWSFCLCWIVQLQQLRHDWKDRNVWRRVRHASRDACLAGHGDHQCILVQRACRHLKGRLHGMKWYCAISKQALKLRGCTASGADMYLVHWIHFASLELCGGTQWFKCAKQVVCPKVNETNTQSRWLHDLVIYFLCREGFYATPEYFRESTSYTIDLSHATSGSSWSPSFSTQALPGAGRSSVLRVFRYGLREFFQCGQVRIRAVFHPLMLVDLVFLGQLGCFMSKTGCQAWNERNERPGCKFITQTWKRYQLKETSLSSVSKHLRSLGSVSLFPIFLLRLKGASSPWWSLLVCKFQAIGRFENGFMTRTCRTFQFNFNEFAEDLMIDSNQLRGLGFLVKCRITKNPSWWVGLVCNSMRRNPFHRLSTTTTYLC